MEYREFSEKELKWIDEFSKVMKKAPKTLFMFIGSGSIVIYPKDKDNNRYMEKYGAVDGYAPSKNISSPIDADGGDW